MRVLITGGTGTIGQRLIPYLLQHGYSVAVLSRRPIKSPALPRSVDFYQWDGKTARGWGHHVEQTDVIINLAGAGIADKRWTDERKKLLLNSRLDAGRAVAEAIDQAQHKPGVLIQASAVGYYGGRLDDTMQTEENGPGDDFLADICVQWEDSTAAVEAMGVRRAVIRTGIVLDPEGGALPQMVRPFKFFAGGPVGSGQQWFPWIHWLDEVSAIRFLIETESASGAINLVAPNPTQNHSFAKTVGSLLSRPAIAPAPSLALQLVFGELSEALIKGQRALPARLQALGYHFIYPQLEPALRNLLLGETIPTAEHAITA